MLQVAYEIRRLGKEILMGFLGLFRRKETTWTKEAQEGSGMGDGMGPDMMNELAAMPDGVRTQMMKGRLEQLLTLPEEKRQEAIRGMIASFHHDKVKESDRETLIALRTEIIGGLPEDRRRTMMMSRMRAMMEAPQLEEADKAVIEKVMPRVPAEARKAFVDTMADLMKQSQS